MTLRKWHQLQRRFPSETAEWLAVLDSYFHGVRTWEHHSAESFLHWKDNPQMRAAARVRLG